MKIKRKIRKQIAHDKDGIQVAGELNADIAINVNEQQVPAERKAARNKAREERGRSAPR